MSDDELSETLASYRVPEAGPELTDRVMERIAASPRTHRLYVAAAAGLAVVAAIAVLAIFVRTPATVHGSYAKTGQASLELGARGIAVVEDGAELAWEVAGDGTARIEQRAGSVFYRVERGGPFSVETPAGTITVRGTCFRVEVRPMPITRQHVTSAALGAVVAAAVVVVVYEGGVRVVNARGTVDLAAGERGHVETGGAPSRDGSATARSTDISRLGTDATRAQLVTENEQIRDQLAAAQATVTTLQNQLAEMRSDGRAKPSNVDPTKDQLLAWAQKCEIHIDAPSVFGATPSHIDKRDVTEWGLTKTEPAALERALAELHGKAREDMREIYIAATNNVAGADELTGNAMLSEIENKASPADQLRARQRLARERAGLQAPPPVTDMSPYERALRLLIRLGNDFERMVGDVLGAPRAHELRTRFNAWPGLQLSDSSCDETAR